MKKALYFFPFIALFATGCQLVSVKPGPNPGPVACTQEAKLCPDGSYVGRTGPSCEFAACPNPSPVSSLQSGIEGMVTLGPTCPVQRLPPDPQCADRPYQATVKVETADGQSVTQFSTGNDGKFKLGLAPGSYVLVPLSNNVYPRAKTQAVTVERNKFTQITIMFDTGIR